MVFNVIDEVRLQELRNGLDKDITLKRWRVGRSATSKEDPSNTPCKEDKNSKDSMIQFYPQVFNTNDSESINLQKIKILQKSKKSKDEKLKTIPIKHTKEKRSKFQRIPSQISREEELKIIRSVESQARLASQGYTNNEFVIARESRALKNNFFDEISTSSNGIKLYWWDKKIDAKKDTSFQPFSSENENPDYTQGVILDKGVVTVTNCVRVSYSKCKSTDSKGQEEDNLSAETDIHIETSMKDTLLKNIDGEKDDF